MSKRTKIAFIIEGVKTEPLLIENLKKHFFCDAEIITILLPTCTHIYSLYEKIKEDDYETDIIEITKELCSTQQVKRVDKFNLFDFRSFKSKDFSEIYLFFDYDGHTNSLPNLLSANMVMGEMLSTFDNETDLGRLYISYPMVESIKDFSLELFCNNEDICFCKVEDGIKYKQYIGSCSIVQDVRKFNKEHWKIIILRYLSIVSCLFELELAITPQEYKQVDPKKIFRYQLAKLDKRQQIMILSAFPEFLLDYFKIEKLEEFLEVEQLFDKITYFEDSDMCCKRTYSSPNR